ncbi:uncharacterized protein [Asterias amurensis]|uniref:uncharacterized protein n=1 Tax=Asterias amurensis TaxID=7602 RepID=UPI003AB5FC54
MTALVVATLAFCLVWCHKVSPISAGCGNMFLPDQHHALVGHSFLSQTGTGRIQCMMLCWRHSRCLSFNHDDTSGICQLNNARKQEFPESYKQDDNLSYFSSSNKIHGWVFETTMDKIATVSSTAATTTTAAATTTTAAPTITRAAPITTTAAPTTTTAEATTTTVAATKTIATTTSNNCGLGMESGAIADSQITANNVSNNDYTNYGPTLARFNGESSWCGKKTTARWIQVDMGRMEDLYAIIVQGRNGGNGYVAHFYLSYSDDGVTWTDIVNEDDGRNKYHFSNGSDKKDVRVSVESAPSVGMIRCRYIRIRPSGWVYDVCMRFELIGC